MTRFAVVGANGMLGQAVSQALLARAGDELVALDLPVLDIADRNAVESCEDLRHAEVVINCAAFTNVEACEEKEALATRVNGTGVENLARLTNLSGALLVHVSTDFVFDGSRTMPYPVDATPAPLSAYGRSKLAGEDALFRDGGRVVCVRTSWLFGEHGPNFIETMLRLAEQHGKLAVVCDQVGSPTYTHDLAAALLALADRRASGMYHFSNAGECSWHQFACEIVQQAGLDVPVEPITTDEAQERFGLKAVRPAYSVLDCNDIEALTCIRRRPWQKALAEYLQKRVVTQK